MGMGIGSLRCTVRRAARRALGGSVDGIGESAHRGRKVASCTITPFHRLRIPLFGGGEDGAKSQPDFAPYTERLARTIYERIASFTPRPWTGLANVWSAFE